MRQNSFTGRNVKLRTWEDDWGLFKRFRNRRMHTCRFYLIVSHTHIHASVLLVSINHPSRTTTQKPLYLRRQNLMNMRSQMRRVKPKILLHGLTSISLRISNNIRLIPCRAKPSSILDTIRCWILQHTIQKSVCIEERNSRICIDFLEFCSVGGENRVELGHHAGVWKWVAFENVFGGLVERC